jgi:hypothetical protein
MELYGKLSEFFEEVLRGLQCQQATRAYLISLYSQYRISDFDLSKESITLQFISARENQSFATYQQIADWIMFCQTLAPQHLHNASSDYYRTLGQLSYYSCYQLINRKWLLFEELADNFLPIETQIKTLLIQHSIDIER